MRLHKSPKAKRHAVAITVELEWLSRYDGMIIARGNLERQFRTDDKTEYVTPLEAIMELLQCACDDQLSVVNVECIGQSGKDSEPREWPKPQRNPPKNT